MYSWAVIGVVCNLTLLAVLTTVTCCGVFSIVRFVCNLTLLAVLTTVTCCGVFSIVRSFLQVAQQRRDELVLAIPVGGEITLSALPKSVKENLWQDMVQTNKFAKAIDVLTAEPKA